MPTLNVPKSPPTPCTEMAPTGSSIPRRSKKYTDSMIKIAATTPITAAAHGETKAHGAVIATRPASMPFTIMPGSGLPVFRVMYNMAAIEPKAPAIAVLVAATANCTSVAAKVLAALKPNHPNNKINVPSIAIGTWCPAMVRGLPSAPNLPIRGPITIAPVSAATPPTRCTTPEPAKST